MIGNLKITKAIRRRKSNSGITLIALIITIIVMLILAGVTISIVVNGRLFGQAQNATQATKDKAVKEQAALLQVEYEMWKIGKEPDNKLQDFINKKVEAHELTDEGNGIYKDKNGYYFGIEPDEKGKDIIVAAGITNGDIIVSKMYGYVEYSNAPDKLAKGVSVKVYDGETLIAETETDSDGFFIIENLNSKKTYTVQFSRNFCLGATVTGALGNGDVASGSNVGLVIGDYNNDGVINNDDLSQIIYLYYGIKEGDSKWEEAEIFDLNGNRSN